MADWFSSAVQGLKNAASGARYMVAPNESERAGDELQGRGTLDKVNDYLWGSPQQQQERAQVYGRSMQNTKAGTSGLSDFFVPGAPQAKAQLAAEKGKATGPMIGPRSTAMQIRDALEYINPTPLGISLADMLGGDTDASAARDPYNADEWNDMPTPQTGMTRIGVGTDAATRLGLRQNLTTANQIRAEQVWKGNPAILDAWEKFSTRYPRIAAHMSPMEFSDEIERASLKRNKAPAGASMNAGFGFEPRAAKVGNVTMNPKVMDADEAFKHFAHEGTHAARSIRRADRGADWGQEYRDEMDRLARDFPDEGVAYLLHPEEQAANMAMESAVRRADKVATRDAMRQLEQLAGVR